MHRAVVHGHVAVVGALLAAQVEPRPKKEAAVRKALEELYKPKGETKKVRARRPLACVQRRLAVAHFYQKFRTASWVLQKLTTRMAAVSRPSRFPPLVVSRLSPLAVTRRR